MAIEQLGSAPSTALHTATKNYVDTKFSGAATAGVIATESTTSTGFVDLATVTDSVTVTIGTSGMALVIVHAIGQNTTAGAYADMSYAVSGATTLAADTNQIVRFTQTLTASSGVFLQTGLTAGSNTFKAKYRQQAGGTATFLYRRIAAIPL